MVPEIEVNSLGHRDGPRCAGYGIEDLVADSDKMIELRRVFSLPS